MYFLLCLLIIFLCFLVPIIKRQKHAPQKEVLYVSQEQPQEETEDWEEEGSEEGESSSGGEQSEYSDASYDTDDEEKIPQQTQPVSINQPLKNLVMKEARKPEIVSSSTHLVTPTQQHQVSRKKLKRKNIERQIQPELEAAPITLKLRKRSKVSHETDVSTSSKLESHETNVSTSSKLEISGGNTEPAKDDRKKLETMYDDSNIDVNLYTSAPQNITEKKIMLGSNLLVVCKMIEAIGEKGQSYEYAAISLQRKMKSQKAYTFNMPLNLINTLIHALDIIKDANQTYLSK